MGSIGNSQENFTKGRDSFAAGNYTSAIAYFGKVIDEDPKNVDAYNTRAAANIKIGNYNQAITDFEHSIALDPSNEFALNNRDMLLKADRIESNFDKGVSYMDSRNYQLAIAYFDEVIKDDPHNGDAYVNRSVAFTGLGDYWEALRSIELAITIDPSNKHLVHNRVDLLTNYPVLSPYPLVFPPRTDFGPTNRYPLETFNKEGISSVDLGKVKRGLEDLKLKWIEPLDKSGSD